MTYKINGSTITAQPTSGQWVEREQIGTSGSGYPIYSNVRSFQLVWNLMTPSDYSELVSFFDSIGITGSAVVDLPKWGANSYTFESYTGCVLGEPIISAYFNEHVSEVKLLVARIRT